jgi:hypothetical protein
LPASSPSRSRPCESSTPSRGSSCARLSDGAMRRPPGCYVFANRRWRTLLNSCGPHWTGTWSSGGVVGLAGTCTNHIAPTTDRKVWGSNPYRRATPEAAGQPADLRLR